MDGAFFTGAYTNAFEQIGVTQDAVDACIAQAYHTIFEDETERFFHEHGDDMGYMEDTGNHDVRTEGMSYGMMVCVQLNKKDVFDRLWFFAKRYMWHEHGKYAGYFAWSVGTDGTRNAQGPAPDGEEHFALALLFASRRWGDGAPPFDYGAQARDILRHCVHQDELTPGGMPMWERANHLIKFVPELGFTDPSYHLPHFYELFSLWANEEDRPFWRRAAEASRAFLTLACHPVTGLVPEYAHYDGTPEETRGHSHYFSDAYRVMLNIGLDAAWFGKRPELTAIANNVQRFFSERTSPGAYAVYTVDGRALDEPALHPVAIIATNAAGSLAADGPYRLDWLRTFFNTPLRQGDRRYYDNFLYLFSLMALAGRFTILL